jgi:hypothetical protein
MTTTEVAPLLTRSGGTGPAINARGLVKRYEGRAVVDGELASRGEGGVPSHTKVHHGFPVERDPGGRWRTYRPDGTEILIHPRL